MAEYVVTIGDGSMTALKALPSPEKALCHKGKSMTVTDVTLSVLSTLTTLLLPKLIMEEPSSSVIPSPFSAGAR